MPLGREVGLGPGDIVLDGDPAPPKKGAHPPIFSPCLLRPNGCMYQDTTWYEGRVGAVPFLAGSWVPVKQNRLGRGLHRYQVAS